MSEPLLDQDFIARLERLELVSRKIVSGKLKGERRSRRRGSSTEFADFRPYVPGDDLRFLDWNILGRLDRLFLRVFLEEEDLWLDILVDASESMRWGDPDKFTYARRVAAALGYIGLVQQDRVRVSAFSSRLRPIFGPARGRRQAKRLLEQLESLDVERGEGTHLAPSFERFARTGGRTGIAVVV
ncbi:MAG TPA: DUF58 domain-containing protein, partial [Planctomycetota bacterium]|nr:DUF58 domain-containing protein [Planctomycetota bacterium]